MKHYAMLDLETLGNSSRAPIIQIGLVFFTTEEILLERELSIDFEQACKYGEMDASTIKWWFKQSDEARKSASSGILHPKEAVEIIRGDFASAGINHTYAHATFDFPIFDNLCRQLDKQNPIDFRTCCDMRTLESFVGNDITWEPRNTVLHTALGDALWQAKHAQKMLSIINAME
jgi:DNA polymerase III epsilon subunit-like protein